MPITHSKVSSRPDGTDSSLIQPSDWNDDHVIDILTLPATETPSLPPADNVNIFGRNVGGRMMPAMIDPSGLDTTLQPLIGRNSVSSWIAAGNNTIVNVLGAASALAATGTATAALYALTNIHTKFKRIDYLVTTAAPTAVAGARSSTTMWSRDTGFQFIMRGSPATGQSTTSTTGRFWMGMANTTAAPTDVAPSTQTLCVGCGFEGTDTTMFMYVNDASGTCTRVALTGIPRYTTDRATMFELALFAAPGSSSIRYEVTDLSTMTRVRGELTTDLPLLSTLLAPRIWASVGGTSSVIGVTLVNLYLESDM